LEIDPNLPTKQINDNLVNLSVCLISDPTFPINQILLEIIDHFISKNNKVVIIDSADLYRGYPLQTESKFYEVTKFFYDLTKKYPIVRNKFLIYKQIFWHSDKPERKTLGFYLLPAQKVVGYDLGGDYKDFCKESNPGKPFSIRFSHKGLSEADFLSFLIKKYFR
jgi:hypothetical protein